MTNKILVECLNDDLSAELGTIIRYTYQAGKADGLLGEEFRELLERDIPDEIRHAAFLTDVISDYGGEPTTVPQGFRKSVGLKSMAELDLEMESQDIENYKQHARLAEASGDIELKVRLEEMAADESHHAREFRRILRGFNGKTWLDKDIEPGIHTIGREQLQKMLASGKQRVKLVDVLGEEYFAKEHIKGAINIPVNQLEAKADRILRKDDFIIVYCANLECQASPTAAAILKAKGFPFVFDYAAGLKDYKEAGLPVEGALHKKASMSK